MNKLPAKKRKFKYIPRQQQLSTKSHQSDIWQKYKIALHDNTSKRNEERLILFRSLLENIDSQKEKIWASQILRDLDINLETFKICEFNPNLCNIIIDYLIYFPVTRSISYVGEEFREYKCFLCDGKNKSPTLICSIDLAIVKRCHVICTKCNPEFENCIKGKIISYPEVDNDYKLYLLWNGLIDFDKYWIKY